MSTEQNAIQKLYTEPKSKGFVNHLIGAYLPVNKTEKVWDFKSGQKHQCNICGAKIFSIQTVFENMQKNDEKIRAEFLPFISKQVDGSETKMEEHPMYKYVTQGAVQAWTGKDTNTCLCLSCVNDLLELVQNGILSNDKNLTWIVNKMRREQTFDIFRSNANLTPEDKSEVDRIEKSVERSKEKKITTFGDLEILQNLKAKMEAENDKSE
jgi:hypothetical protein